MFVLYNCVFIFVCLFWFVDLVQGGVIGCQVWCGVGVFLLLEMDVGEVREVGEVQYCCMMSFDCGEKCVECVWIVCDWIDVVCEVQEYGGEEGVQ